jgi:hypothetical protein
MPSRRELLRRTAAAAVGTPVVGGGRADGTRRGSGGRPDAFDPVRHAFGFRNWSTADPYFPSHDHDRVSRAEIERTMGRRWSGVTRRLFGVPFAALPDPLVSAVAEQLYVSANQFAAANGHCYGMTYAAQRYYERPDAVPLGREHASRFGHPEAPSRDDSRDPVSQDVDVYQTAQLLDPYAWIGRRDLLSPRRIDYGRHLAAVRAAVDAFGTASVSLLNSTTYAAHEVLAYDYADEGAATRLYLYDPNFGAGFYRSPRRRERLSLLVAPGRDPPIDRYTAGTGRDPRSGGTGYDTFVYNRWERLIAARNGPDEHPAAERPDARLREQLLGVLGITTDAPGVALRAVGPDGRPVGRIRSGHMDRSRTDVHAIRSRYGPDPGTYRLVAGAAAATDYTLAAVVADRSGERLDATESRSLAAGRSHEYRLTIPEGDADATLERAGTLAGLPDWTPVAAGVAAGAAVAALGVGYARRG